MGFVHPRVSAILNFDGLGRLKYWEGRMNISDAYILRNKTDRTLIWRSYRSQLGGKH
jgi:hypothetical protein